MPRISTTLSGSSGVILDYQPVFQIEGCTTERLLRSIGEDPQIDLRLPGVLPLGFYRVSVELLPTDGSLGAPLLYVDDAPVPLRSRMGGREWTALLRAPEAGIHRVRLDPADREVSFFLGDILLETLTDLEAIREMRRELDLRGDRSLGASSIALEHQAEGMYARYLDRSGLVPSASDPLSGSYSDWVARFDHVSSDTIQQWRQQMLEWPRRPFVSIILPVYNTAERWLRECLDSVRAQAYVDWELCIADDASPDPSVRVVLEEYAARDSRIRVHFREKNGHISASSNSALAMARGEFVALLDHDDLLPPHALFEVARAIIERPDVGLIYSDEDKVSEDGDRFDPYFKPAWNPDLFLSQNYVSHFGVYRTSLVRDVGGFREGYEGSQDYDLALRCIGRLTDDQIVHIPKILYHWRAIAGSTALALGEKSYAVDAGQRALMDHLRRADVNAEVTTTSGGYRVKRQLPSELPLVELFIPTRDRVDLLALCVRSIIDKTTYSSYRICIIDNGSVEEDTFVYFESLAGDARVRILRDDSPFNYSRLNNRAVSTSEASIVGLVNNDIEVISPDWLEEMVGHALRPEIGAVGAMLYYPNDTIQHAGVIVGMHGVAGHIYSGAERGHAGQMGRPRLLQNLTAVTAACLVVRRAVWQQVGGLDESLTVAFNDVDFCLRVATAGYLNVWTPFAELYHHESASRGYEDTPEKKARFEREIAAMHERWSSWFVADPAHNPNLSLYAFSMVPAFPPRVGRPRLGGRASQAALIP